MKNFTRGVFVLSFLITGLFLLSPISVSAQTTDPVVTITASPAVITVGQSSTITWTSTNATSCTSPFGSSIPTSGSIVVNPDQTMIYQITCTRQAIAGDIYSGYRTGTNDTTVILSSGGSTTVDLKINGKDNNIFVAGYENVSVTWTTTNTNLCALTAHDASIEVPTNGSLTMTVPWIVNQPGFLYSIRCRDSNGNLQTDTVLVTSTSAPTVSHPAPIPFIATMPGSECQAVNVSWGSYGGSNNLFLSLGFKIFRDGVQVGTALATDYNFQDRGLTPGKTYQYTVKAIGTNGDSLSSNVSSPAQIYPCTTNNTPGTPTNPTPSSQKFIIGDRVEVATASTSGLNTRASASTSASSLCTQSDGSLGTILNGPVSAGGYAWWQVNYDQGCDGWGAENYLVKAAGSYTPISIPLPIILPSPSTPSTPSTPSSPTKPTNTSSTVNLKANGSDGPLSIGLGTAVNLSWAVSGQTSCYKSSTPASEFTGALIPINSGSLPVYPTSSVQYNITCGNYSDSVTINVNGNVLLGGDYVNPYRAFAVGDTVQATVLLNVRSGATINASVVTSVSSGTTGTVLAGPISANGHNWWQINYTGGQSGWSSGAYLSFVSSANTNTSSQVTSTGCASIYGYSTTTGRPCTDYFSTTTGGTGSYPPGCASSSGYSSTTGQPCGGTNTGTNTSTNNNTTYQNPNITTVNLAQGQPLVLDWSVSSTVSSCLISGPGLNSLIGASGTLYNFGSPSITILPGSSAYPSGFNVNYGQSLNAFYSSEGSTYQLDCLNNDGSSSVTKKIIVKPAPSSSGAVTVDIKAGINSYDYVDGPLQTPWEVADWPITLSFGASNLPSGASCSLDFPYNNLLSDPYPKFTPSQSGQNTNGFILSNFSLSIGSQFFPTASGTTYTLTCKDSGGATLGSDSVQVFKGTGGTRSMLQPASTSTGAITANFKANGVIAQ